MWGICNEWMSKTERIYKLSAVFSGTDLWCSGSAMEDFGDKTPATTHEPARRPTRAHTPALSSLSSVRELGSDLPDV